MSKEIEELREVFLELNELLQSPNSRKSFGSDPPQDLQSLSLLAKDLREKKEEENGRRE